MIDVHTHSMLAEHYGRHWEECVKPVYGTEWPLITPQSYDEAMCGVDLTFVFGMQATAAGIATPTDYIVDFCARTRTPTVGFMALDPTDPDVLEQLAYGVSKGLRGVKIYPVLALFDPREERFDPFYRAVEAAGLILMWHMGATPSHQGRLEVSQPILLDAVARRHPGITQIIAHLGHPWQRETMILLRKNRRMFSDVSGAWARPFEGYRALIRAQEWGVVDKLLFASDFPLWTPTEAAQGLRRLATLGADGMPRVAADTIDWLINGDPRAQLGVG